MSYKRRLFQFVSFMLLCVILLPTVAEATGDTSDKLDATSDTIEELQNHKEEQLDNLEDLKDYQIELSEEIESLNSSLQDISSSMEDLQAQVDDLNTQIAENENNIEALNTQITSMYDAMKKRIKYTYEHGSTNYINALFEAESFTDFLNRAEYVKKIQDYDREQVEAYELAVAQVKIEQEELESSKAELLAATEAQKTKKEEADALIAKQQSNLAAVGSNINDVETDVENTNTELAKQQAYEAELEKQKAEEDAKRLEEIAQQEQELGNTTVTPVEATESDLALLAAIIQCEAGGESYEGKLAVGSVVMNRVASSYFPNTIVEVIYQNKQFSPVASGRFATVLAQGANAECIQAANDVLAGARNVNCLYFRTNNGLITGTVIGNHVFY